MTRKDYQKIARNLRENKPTKSPRETAKDYLKMLNTWEKIVTGLTVILAEENANFDRERFLEACGFFSYD